MKFCVGLDNPSICYSVVERSCRYKPDYYKINPWYFHWRNIDGIVRSIRERSDAKIILDAKIIDITKTVEAALGTVRDMGVDAVTIGPSCPLSPFLKHRDMEVFVWTLPTEYNLSVWGPNFIIEKAEEAKVSIVVGANWAFHLDSILGSKVRSILVPGIGPQWGFPDLPNDDRIISSASRQWKEMLERYK